MFSVSVLIFTIVAIQYDRDQQDKYEKRALSDAYDMKRVGSAKHVSNKLLAQLRNAGIGGELIVDIKSDDVGNVLVVVSNGWLGLPYYEQNQNKQIIFQMTKQIVPPNGWDLTFVDVTGNKY